MTFRYLVDGIETNRALVQVQKEQIERKKVFLEGLHYYKVDWFFNTGNSQKPNLQLQNWHHQRRWIHRGATHPLN